MRCVACLARLGRVGLVALLLGGPLSAATVHASPVDTDVDEDDGLDVPEGQKVGDPDEIKAPDAQPRAHDEIPFPDAQPRSHDEIPFPDAQPPDPDAP